MWFVKRHGYGKVKSTGQRVGLGLSTHLENMRRIIWPELDGEHNGQRWHQLCRDNIAEHKVTVLLGAGSTGKTHSAAWIALCQWMSNPLETCVLVSSTDMRGLRLRVWGEISMLWQKAIQRFDFLPGHMLDSKLAITAETLDDDGDENDRLVRDFRSAIIGIPTVQNGKQVGLGKWIGLKQKNVILVADECFPAGTLVDTPTGPRPIEAIRPGDEVLNPCGVDRVIGIKKSLAKQLVRIKTTDGREFVCTPNHPILTQHGWVKAIAINKSSYLVSTDEAMRVLRWGFSSSFKQPRLQEVQEQEDFPRMQMLRNEIPRGTPQLYSQVLFQELCNQMEPSTAGLQAKFLFQGARGENLNLQAPLAQTASWICEKGFCAPPFQFQYAKNAGRKSADAITQARESIMEFCHSYGALPAISKVLPSGHHDTEITPHSGGRRASSFDSRTAGTRSKARQFTHGAWVESCEILKPSHSKKDIRGGDGIEVFNLHVENFHAYSINGIAIKNCQFMGPSFLSAFANLNKNERFRAICLGNPNDTLDPLGKAAEPLDGWDDHMEPDKTSVWKTRFMEGVCVNLIGTDSPNFDFPENEPPRFKYLINRQTIAETLSFFAKDSFEYYSQCVGAMKIGSLARRVLTRRICEQGNALDVEVNWDGSTTKVYYVDAAYGGDRCIGGWGEFGKSVAGDTILLLHQPVNIPISVRADKEPEQQIAEHMKRECEGLSIPPENAGHDSTGRGSLGTFLARVWSAFVQPIEAGGQPTDRPVSQTHYIRDPKTRARRLKTCKEHYVKLVTEFWFSVRYTVEAGQLRGLTEEAMEELCQRQWDRVKDDKIEVETKEEMKQRIGRSPDLGDWVAGIVEMARRKGFEINKLLNTEEHADTRQWLYAIREQHDEMMSRKQLNHAA